MWPERNPQQVGLQEEPSFSDLGERKKELHHRRPSRHCPEEGDSEQSFKVCDSPRGTRKRGSTDMLWILQMKAILMKTKAASFLPTPSSQMIYSYQVSPGIQKICYQTGNEKISISSTRKGEESHPYRDRKSTGQDPSHGAQGSNCSLLSQGMQSLLPPGFNHPLCKDFRPRPFCYGALDIH